MRDSRRDGIDLSKRGRTGIDHGGPPNADMPRMIRWPRKSPGQTSTGNDIVPDFAPSVAEADAILAQFGYVEREAVLA